MSLAPSLNLPRLGDPISAECSYVRRASSLRQAASWNATLASDPVFGPTSGLSVGVGPVKDPDGCWPLVWVVP